MTPRTGLLTLMAAAMAAAATAAPPVKTENGLIGIRLFDPASKIIRLYGTPDSVQGVAGGGITAGGGGNGGGGAPSGSPFGRGGPGGPPPGFPGSGGGGSNGPRGSAGADLQTNPFSFGDMLARQRGPQGAEPQAPGGGGGAPPFGGPPGGFPGRGGGAPGAPQLGGGQTGEVTLTRWIYNRSGSKYGFVVNRTGSVVQIEAIGLANRSVKTRRGLGFGATFGSIIRAYGNPDGYEINGDNLLVKYLNRQKIAFRLSRLGPKKPQVVTGIVVSAAKA